MRLSRCQNCDLLLYFENTHCERCGVRVGYLPDAVTLSAMQPDGDRWQAMATPDRPRLFCANAEAGVCNWTVPAEEGGGFCAACRHNRTIPDTSVPENMENWRKLEYAKHRLFYSLLRFRLPLANRNDDPEGLAFDFLTEAPGAAGPRVMTGHDNGLITIAAKEADDAERELMRKNMGEPYRTLLGHFRHEVGHYFWDRLVRDGGRLEDCRAVFGDDGEDYGAALQRHYAEGAKANWQEHFVSAYATTHPWEDFAETWAHYLHIVDTLETASTFGLRVKPELDTTGELSARIDYDPYEEADIHRIVEDWLPLAFAVNSLNRSMGQPDLYPFVLSPAVIAKLGFVHDLIRSGGRPVA